VVGIDRSPAQVTTAQRLRVEGVKKGDLLEAVRSLPSQSQDVVIAFDVIEHLTKEELLDCADHVYRILRPGGRWIIHAPNGESPFAGRIRYGDFTHELAFTRTSLTQLLLASRFTHVACYEDSPVPHGIKSAVRWLLWKAIRGGLRLYLAVETGAGDSACLLSQNFLAVASK
jgi:cyclopropane fatty-acyl-phospholipid synthase-like methyltransferase